MVVKSEQLTSLEAIHIQPTYDTIRIIAHQAILTNNQFNRHAPEHATTILASITAGDPKRFPKQRFQLGQLSDETFNFFLLNYDPNMPYYRALEREKERRLGKDPNYKEPKQEDQRKTAPANLMSEIVYPRR